MRLLFSYPFHVCRCGVVIESRKKNKKNRDVRKLFYIKEKGWHLILSKKSRFTLARDQKSDLDGVDHCFCTTRCQSDEDHDPLHMLFRVNFFYRQFRGLVIDWRYGYHMVQYHTHTHTHTHTKQHEHSQLYFRVFALNITWTCSLTSRSSSACVITL